MLIPSYCSGAMVMITSLSRRVNANFECWNAWVDLADLGLSLFGVGGSVRW